MSARTVIIVHIIKSRYILRWNATHLCYSPTTFHRFTVLSVVCVMILDQLCQVTIRKLRDLRFIHANFVDIFISIKPVAI